MSENKSNSPNLTPEERIKEEMAEAARRAAREREAREQAAQDAQDRAEYERRRAEYRIKHSEEEAQKRRETHAAVAEGLKNGTPDSRARRKKLFIALAAAAVVLAAVTAVSMVPRVGYSNIYSVLSIEESEVSGRSASLSGCRSLAKNIEIPAEVGGVPVTDISGGGFAGCKKLESVTIPSSVTSIGEQAFRGCTSLESVTIPDGTEAVCESAFEGCEALARVELGDSVSDIRSRAFYGCASLESITLPAGLTELGEDAFTGCPALREIAVSPENDSFASVGGVLYSKSMFRLVRCPEGMSGSLAVPDGVTMIDSGALRGCCGISEVTISDSVVNIGEGAFDTGADITIHAPLPPEKYGYAPSAGETWTVT